NGAVAAGAGDSTHGGGVRNISGGISEGRMIENAESVHAQIELQSFEDGNRLGKAHVPRILPRPPKQIVARIAVCVISGYGEGSGIEILCDSPVTGIQGGGGNNVRAAPNRTNHGSG